MAIFDNIKVGDKVIYYPSWDVFGVVATVTRVTPTGNFTTDETNEILWDKKGMTCDTNIWQRSRVRPYSEEEYEKILECYGIKNYI